jgi:hypothetical protein
MKTFEMVSVHQELLRVLHEAGIRTDDYKYAELFADFEAMQKRGEKVTYAVAVLSEKHSVCQRTVYKVIKRFSRKVDCTHRSPNKV